MKWKHIQFEDGGNPYICFTDKEFERIKNKYGDRLYEIKPGYYGVREEMVLRMGWYDKEGINYDLD